jgi:hypothetical protein
MNDLYDVVDKRYAVISVIGPHAGESVAEIFGKKIQDTNSVGMTFWLNRSQKARPEMVQRLCEEAMRDNEECCCIFVEPSAEGGATPATTVMTARSFSKDGRIWSDLPRGLSPVTGKIGGGAQALVFDRLQLTSATVIVNLWNYADFTNQNSPIQMKRGVSTVCAVKKDMHSHTGRMKRRVMAVGKFCDPFCVYLK